ncbi:cell wall hydrolase [Paenibacillus allorhizosphaerae]|uniref:Spore cortex-lytic enzyme n=1 Tax=Paenibacillus allorhizosphaerae TaxID=2849866 RepID=A0ABN7TDK6_9BACL|nr:cell wall hydrolase [Paenibacillus allorhizosphaerae]CAG7619331.1 Spore cortex-lytic enzyme [Paenibacillus allorhizosphaerae]
MNKAAIVLSLFAGMAGAVTASGTASAEPMKKGAKNEHVLDLQERLTALGYLKGGVTGYYGVLTTEAVRKFQTAQKLTADGVADDTTVDSLKQSVAPKETALDQMARIIYAEARGESFDGQVAIGAVILNRVQSNIFPDTIEEVILQPGQFSAVKDGQFELTPNETAYEAAKKALNGSDPTDGALYYYNPRTAKASWSKARPKIAKIGNHVFTR